MYFKCIICYIYEDTLLILYQHYYRVFYPVNELILLMNLFVMRLVCNKESSNIFLHNICPAMQFSFQICKIISFQKVSPAKSKKKLWLAKCQINQSHRIQNCLVAYISEHRQQIQDDRIAQWLSAWPKAAKSAVQVSATASTNNNK